MCYASRKYLDDGGDGGGDGGDDGGDGDGGDGGLALQSGVEKL